MQVKTFIVAALLVLPFIDVRCTFSSKASDIPCTGSDADGVPHRLPLPIDASSQYRAGQRVGALFGRLSCFGTTAGLSIDAPRHPIGITVKAE